MTNPLTNPIVKAFVHDLDENIVFKQLFTGEVAGMNVRYGDIHIDFINPVTGSVDQVQFEMCEHYETLHRIFYVIDSSKGGTEELEMDSLDDLYDFILIDEDDAPTEVTDLWADEKGGHIMTI
tara:strand:+ start:67 stop:435 length:369 start_codon:yes stop_codon:yes gene_type:complete